MALSIYDHLFFTKNPKFIRSNANWFLLCGQEEMYLNEEKHWWSKNILVRAMAFLNYDYKIAKKIEYADFFIGWLGSKKAEYLTKSSDTFEKWPYNERELIIKNVIFSEPVILYESIFGKGTDKFVPMSVACANFPLPKSRIHPHMVMWCELDNGEKEWEAFVWH